MNVRVVRFTGVTPERIEALQARVKEAGGPPPGVKASGLEVLFDEAQGSAVVLQRFETAADLQEAAAIFDAMEPGETPGTRTSVDACASVLELAP